MVSVWRYDNETAILSLRSLFVGKATRHEANRYISMIADDIKGIVIFTLVCIAVFTLLCSSALCDDHDIIIAELDSDIDEIGQRLTNISNDLINLRIDVAHVTGHKHENQEHRLRLLENELERLHGASNITMWVIGILGILVAPTGIAGLMRISRTAIGKVNGS